MASDAGIGQNRVERRHHSRAVERGGWGEEGAGEDVQGETLHRRLDVDRRFGIGPLCPPGLQRVYLIVDDRRDRGEVLVVEGRLKAAALRLPACWINREQTLAKEWMEVGEDLGPGIMGLAGNQDVLDIVGMVEQDQFMAAPRRTAPYRRKPAWWQRAGRAGR